MKKLLYVFIATLLMSFLLPSCRDNPEPDPCENGFNQEAMFSNLVNNLILPGYQELEAKVNTLANKSDAFLNNVSQTELDALREAWESAYISWQKVAQFSFGPAGNTSLRKHLNSFPTNRAIIEVNVDANIWDFTTYARFDKGFPALDYIINGLDSTDQAILNKYNIENNNYKTYLNEVVTDIQSRVQDVNAEWRFSYNQVFVTNTGTAEGTALSQIVNALSENYELIKREKLGVPSGVTNLGFVYPNRTEGYYGKISTPLLKQALQSAKDFYMGLDGPGLDDFLIEIDAEKEEELLAEVIENRFDFAINIANELEEPLSEIISENAQPVVRVYNEVAANMVPLKTDMPSVLCVAITYIDNPSDSD